MTTSYQTDILNCFLNSVNKNQSFEILINGDDELVLFRNTEEVLTNLIINPNECFALSKIPKDGGSKELNFYDENDFINYKELVDRFFN